MDAKRERCLNLGRNCEPILRVRISNRSMRKGQSMRFDQFTKSD